MNKRLMNTLYDTQLALRRSKESASYQTYIRLCKELDLYKRHNRQLQELNELLLEQNQQLRLFIGDISLEEFWNSLPATPDES